MGQHYISEPLLAAPAALHATLAEGRAAIEAIDGDMRALVREARAVLAGWGSGLALRVVEQQGRGGGGDDVPARGVFWSYQRMQDGKVRSQVRQCVLDITDAVGHPVFAHLPLSVQVAVVGIERRALALTLRRRVRVAEWRALAESLALAQRWGAGGPLLRRAMRDAAQSGAPALATDAAAGGGDGG